MEETTTRTTEQGNTITRELFVDAKTEETPTERILDIEEKDEEESGPPANE